MRTDAGQGPICTCRRVPVAQLTGGAGSMRLCTARHPKQIAFAMTMPFVWLCCHRVSMTRSSPGLITLCPRGHSNTRHAVCVAPVAPAPPRPRRARELPRRRNFRLPLTLCSRTERGVHFKGGAAHPVDGAAAANARGDPSRWEPAADPNGIDQVSRVQQRQRLEQSAPERALCDRHGAASQ